MKKICNFSQCSATTDCAEGSSAEQHAADCAAERPSAANHPAAGGGATTTTTAAATTESFVSSTSSYVCADVSAERTSRHCASTTIRQLFVRSAWQDDGHVAASTGGHGGRCHHDHQCVPAGWTAGAPTVAAAGAVQPGSGHAGSVRPAGRHAIGRQPHARRPHQQHAGTARAADQPDCSAYVRRPGAYPTLPDSHLAESQTHYPFAHVQSIRPLSAAG